MYTSEFYGFGFSANLLELGNGLRNLFATCNFNNCLIFFFYVVITNHIEHMMS